MSQWDYYFRLSAGLSLKYTEPLQSGSLMFALPGLFSAFSLPLLCNLPLSPRYFSKHISAELWVCIM